MTLERNKPMNSGEEDFVNLNNLPDTQLRAPAEINFCILLLRMKTIFVLEMRYPLLQKKAFLYPKQYLEILSNISFLNSKLDLNDAFAKVRPLFDRLNKQFMKNPICEILIILLLKDTSQQLFLLASSYGYFWVNKKLLS